MFVEDLRNKDRKLVDRETKRTNTHSRYIPKDVREAVQKRDGGRCSYVSPLGERCPECSGLQYDHIIPVAFGGETSVENVRLLCGCHNQLAADQSFGRSFMQLHRHHGGRNDAATATSRGAEGPMRGA